MRGIRSHRYTLVFLAAFCIGLFSLGGALGARPAAATQEESPLATQEFEMPQTILFEEETAGTDQNATISVDDGSFEQLVGLGPAGTIYFINRLKPASYPATLSQAQIYFPAGQSNISTGQAITLLAGSNTDGDENIGGASYQQTNATIQGLNQFSTYTLPGITINSGDFLIGFRMTVPSNTYPGALDTSPPSRRRSYVSTNGTSFDLTDNLPGIPSGNFGIRALTVQQSGMLNVSPSTLSFTAAPNQGNPPTKQFTVTNAGSGAMSFSISNSDASLMSVSTASGSLAAGQSQTVTVSVNNPNQPGSRAASLTVSAPGAQNGPQTVAINLNVTAQNTTLSIDDGTYETVVGLTQPGTITFINRLRPPSYPATLSQMQINFRGGTSNLSAGTPITLLVGTNPDGDEGINGETYQQTSGSVQSLGQFNNYNISGPTINSGDFLVGFRIQIPANVYPGALDTNPPSNRRSYVSTDNTNYTLTENLSTVPSGNFGIRAVVSLGLQSAILGVTPTSLQFNAGVNQGNPPSQQFIVSNSGSSSMSFTVGSSDTSLANASPASGTLSPGQSQSISVFVNNPNQQGTRTAALTVNAPGAQNSPQTVTVTVITTGAPAILGVSPSALTFNTVVNQGNPPSQFVTVTNSGSGFMSFTASSSDSGLANVSPSSGSLSAGQSQTITVFANNPNQVGTRQAFLTFTAPGAQNSPRTVNVTVNTTSPPAILSLSPSSLSFNAVVNQGNPPSQLITVTNSGSGFMSFNVGSSDSGLANVSPASGSLSAGQSQTITVFVNNPNQVGTRQAFLTFTAPGAQNSPQTATVTVNTTSPPAVLSTTPSTLNFNAVVNQGNPPSQLITVTNSGSGFMSFTVSSSDSGLANVSPASGSLSAGQSQTITVFVNNPNQVGTRQAFLTFTAPGAQNSPQTATVTVNTTSPPAILSLSPSSLSFNAVVNQGNPPSQLITVTNSGSGFMSFNVSSSDSGLASVSPASGSLSAGQSQTITVFVNNPNQVGTRQAFLTFTAPGAQNSPQTATVTVNTTSPPAILGASPSTLNFNAVVNQGNPPSQLITVTNSGSGFMSFNVSSSDSGLASVSPASGSLSAGQSQTITVFANNPNQVGTRQAFLTFTAPGAQNSPRTVTVTVNTTSPPAILSLSPSSLSFNAVVNQGNPPSQLITVTNSGSGFMSFTVGSSDSGLANVSPASGSLSAGQSQTITVFVNNPNQAGTRQAFLTFTAPGAQNSPQTATVTVNTSGAASILDVSPSAMTFNTVIGQGSPPSQPLTIRNLGSGSFAFTISSSDTSLVNVSPASGTAIAGQDQTVFVFVNNPNLAGTRQAFLTISAPGAQNSPRTVTITVITGGGTPAVLNVTPSSLAFNAVIGQGNPPAQPVTIQNTGGTSFSFNIASSNGLITASPSSGTVAGGQSQVVQVTATNPNTLGTLVAQLTVTAPGAQNSPQTVAVTLTSDIGGAQDESEPNDAPGAPKVISLSSSSLAIGGNARPGDNGTNLGQLTSECDTDASVHDWFRLVVGQRDAYGASLSFQGSDADFNLYLFTQTGDLSTYPQGVQLIDASRLGPGQAESLAPRVLEPGTYYVGVSRVRRNGGSDSVRVNYTLTITRGASPELLSIEDAACVAFAVTLPSTNGQYVVNRVTPSRYPARLEKISILFSAIQGFQSPDGRPVRVIVFADPSGSGTPPANPSLLVNQTMIVDVPSNGDGQFNTLDLSGNGPIVFQGDLYVGYVVDTFNGMLLNTGRAFNPSIRSYVSSNGGFNYQPYSLQDGNGQALNAAIRSSLNTRPFGSVPAGDLELEEPMIFDHLKLLRPRIVPINPE